MQLEIDGPRDIVFEWIPYSKFSNIKEIGNDEFSEVYSAIWKDGPLYDYSLHERKYTRNQYVFALKCLYNSQNFTGEFLNKVQVFFNTFNTVLIILIVIISVYSFNRLNHIQLNMMVKFKYMEYLRIQIQRIIFWFFKVRIIALFVNIY